MHYGLDLGCRHGQPHDMVFIFENPRVKWERCRICHHSFRWRKGYKGKVDNVAYLKAHVRQFAQRTGPTRRIYHKLYRPKQTIIVI